MPSVERARVIVIGGGLAGLSAAIYLSRAKRDVLVVDDGRSMARWEPDVQNYLGFPDGISGRVLLERARQQAERYGTRFAQDHIISARAPTSRFTLRGRLRSYTCSRLLIATGIFHIPPALPDLEPCLGHSMFFCKDCDGYRVQSKSIAIYGWTNEAVRYALGMMQYSACVSIVTDGHRPRWDPQHANWVSEYKIPVYKAGIRDIRKDRDQIRSLCFPDGTEVRVEALFTTRGDVVHNGLAAGLGANLGQDGEVVVDEDMRTTVHGLYAAGCVTPANCQMIIAAGQGATAAQAINRDLLEESLAKHTLHRLRRRQIRTHVTVPKRRRRPAAQALAG